MELNCIGDVCPIPVIKTKKALAEIGENSILAVTVDNIEACENVEKMIKDMGHGYKIGKEGENFTITVTKGAAVASGVAEKAVETAKKGDAVVVIGSDMMGTGDIDLGRTLLKTFIYTLTEQDEMPRTVIFYNSGVRLTTDGSQSLNDLKTLAENGVDIISCGACLNYYHLAEKLAIGRVSNMYEITAVMLAAGVVVKP